MGEGALVKDFVLPIDGEWTPERPPEIKALDQEFVELTRRKAEETFRMVWAGARA